MGLLPTETPVNAPEGDSDDPIPPSCSPHTRDDREDGFRAITVEMMWGAPKGGQGGRLFTQTLLKRADASSVPQESQLCHWQWQAGHLKSS